MDATTRRIAPTSGQLGPKSRVWGAPQQAEFHRFSGYGKSVKRAGVLTPALLAVLRNLLFLPVWRDCHIRSGVI